MKVVIVGYGIVGKNLHEIFPAADIHDPFLGGGFYAPEPEYDVAFVCVPTPLDESSGSLDVSIVEDAIAEVEARVYVLKSTVPPGTTNRLRVTTGKEIVFSPEYQGETIHNNEYDFPFVILGGPREPCDVAAELYKARFTGEIRIHKTDSVTAELTKFMENAFIATKVTFVNEFAALADQLDVDRDELRELWLADPRVGRSHSYAFRGQPYYDSKCLNKDVPGIVTAAEGRGVQMPLLRAVIHANELRKR